MATSTSNSQQMQAGRPATEASMFITCSRSSIGSLAESPASLLPSTSACFLKPCGLPPLATIRAMATAVRCQGDRSSAPPLSRGCRRRRCRCLLWHCGRPRPRHVGHPRRQGVHHALGQRHWCQHHRPRESHMPIGAGRCPCLSRHRLSRHRL